MTDLSDTAPTLAAIAPLADGPVTIEGIGFTRGHETDPAPARQPPDSSVWGVPVDGAARRPDHLAGSTLALVQTYDDHRTAMSFAVLGLRAPGVRIADSACVGNTYPRFFEHLAAATASAR